MGNSDSNIRGPPGIQGVRGPRGIAGLIGQVGPGGPDGAIGLAGPKGPQGPQGIDGFFALQEVWPYEYKTGPWGLCDQTSGKRQRTVNCVDPAGQVVDDGFCAKFVNSKSSQQDCIMNGFNCQNNPETGQKCVKTEGKYGVYLYEEQCNQLTDEQCLETT